MLNEATPGSSLFVKRIISVNQNRNAKGEIMEKNQIVNDVKSLFNLEDENIKVEFKATQNSMGQGDTIVEPYQVLVSINKKNSAPDTQE